MRTVLLGVLMLVSSVASADKVGEWETIVNDRSGLMDIFAHSSSGASLTRVCFQDGSCAWGLGLPVRCNDREEYPALVNTEEGASLILLTCLGSDKGPTGLWSYYIKGSDQVRWSPDATIRGQWAFATPGLHSTIVVYRFSTEGLKQAFATQEVYNAKRVRRDPSTRDTTL